MGHTSHRNLGPLESNETSCSLSELADRYSVADVGHLRVDLLTNGRSDQTILSAVLLAHFQAKPEVQMDHRRVHVSSDINVYRPLFCHVICMHTHPKELDSSIETWEMSAAEGSSIRFRSHQRH